MVIQKITRENILLGGLGRFFGSLGLARARRHMVRGEKHIRRDVKHAKNDAQKEDIKKVAKYTKKATKDLTEALHGEEGILKETLKYTGQIEEDEQELIKLLEKIAQGGFPPALTQDNTKVLVPITKQFIQELVTDREVIADLEKNARILLDRLQRVSNSK